MDFSGFRYIVVGAGLWGLTLAERIAKLKKEKVLILEAKPHPGGNCYSYMDQETNIEVHQYGSHIFHTNNDQVWDYINQFSGFNNYRHKVLTKYKNEVFTMPINLMTINQFYKKNLTPKEASLLLQKEALSAQIDTPQSFEEVIVAQIGYPLYNAFIKGYTVKQWNQDPKDLPAYIIKRLPVRYNYNLNYFDDCYQGIPKFGYGEIFKRMLQTPGIEIRYNVDYFAIRDQLPKDAIIFYSGPIDKYFDYCYGELSWRSLTFKAETVLVNDFQGTSVMNFADMDTPYTRCHEFRHYHPELDYSNLSKTIIFYEKSKETKRGEVPYYPIGLKKDKEIYEKYKTQAQTLKNVYLGGRLGEYAYMDMHQVILKALDLFAQI